MKCPNHNCELAPCLTQYGVRWACPADGCTVACWDGSTSTPADAETRTLRRECHKLFDPLWKQGPRRIFRYRWQAYAELRRIMGTSISKSHIGMFNKEQCLKLLAELKAEATT